MDYWDCASKVYSELSHVRYEELTESKYRDLELTIQRELDGISQQKKHFEQMQRYVLYFVLIIVSVIIIAMILYRVYVYGVHNQNHTRTYRERLHRLFFRNR